MTEARIRFFVSEGWLGNVTEDSVFALVYAMLDKCDDLEGFNMKKEKDKLFSILSKSLKKSLANWIGSMTVSMLGLLDINEDAGSKGEIVALDFLYAALGTLLSSGRPPITMTVQENTEAISNAMASYCSFIWKKHCELKENPGKKPGNAKKRAAPNLNASGS